MNNVVFQEISLYDRQDRYKHQVGKLFIEITELSVLTSDELDDEQPEMEKMKEERKINDVKLSKSSEAASSTYTDQQTSTYTEP